MYLSDAQQNDTEAWERLLLQARQEFGQRQALQSNAWAQWEYSSEEWALFEKIDWKPISRIFWLSVGLCILFIIPFLPADIGLLIWSALYNVFPTVILSIILLVGGSIVFFIPLIVYGHKHEEAKKRHNARQKQIQPHRVTFSEKGVWEAGTYFPLHKHDFVLDEVKMTPQPPVLHFRRKTIFSGTDGTSQDDTLRVLVPHGHEEEAAHLVQRFRTEVIEAHKQALQQLMNPPEPSVDRLIAALDESLLPGKSRVV